MTPSVIIAAIAVTLSLLTFVATQFGMNTNQKTGYIDSLEAKIKRLEERIRELEEENIRLLRKIFAGGG